MSLITYPFFCVSRKQKNKAYYREVIGRSYKDFDETTFRADVGNLDTDEIFVDDDPDRTWMRLYVHILAIIEIHCPLRILRIIRTRPKYLTEDILALMRRRDKAFKLARSQNSPTTWNLARSLRSKVARELRNA